MRNGSIERLFSALSDRYTIHRELGAGGMATVYLAHDVKHDRKVALKVLKPELAAVVGSERFLAEIRTTASLQHPHILPLFDSGEADGFLFYVMPYVEGESLRNRLDREGELPVEEAVRTATAVANALDYAHRHGVIHRDIKPANIMIHDGQPLVADFGIALAVSAAGVGRLTETGLSLGTPYYMSPEQATGERGPDPRSDIYSLGCVLYEMLVGEPPYTGASAQAVLGKILTTDPVRPTDHRRTIPAHVEAAVLTALQKRPADRFRSAREFAEALKNAAFRSLATSSAEHDGGRAWRRSRLTNVHILTLTTVAATVLAVVGWLHNESHGSLPLILTETSIPEFRDGMGTSFALSPDGTLLAFLSEVDEEGRLWLLDRRTLQARPIPGTEDALTAFFSPDGQRIGFITQGFLLKTTSLLGEAQLTLGEKAVRTGAHWGEDGRIYFAVGTTSGEVPGLRRVSAEGGTVETLTQVDTAAGEIAHYLPQLLPSGRGVLFTVVRDRVYDPSTMEIALLDLASRSYRTLVRGVLARATGSGFIVVITADGVMLGIPFDEQRMEVGDPTVPLVEGVRVDRYGNTDLATSAGGMVMYATVGSSSGMRELVWVDRTGGTERLDSTWVARFTEVSLSPNGKTVATSMVTGGDEQIWIRELERGTGRQLRFEGGNIGRIRTWTPDGREVAFWKGYALTTLPVDGGAQTEWIKGGFPGSISFSPDGEQVVFSFAQGGQMDLYTARRNDSLPRPLVATEHAESGGAIAPDGRWLAYVSDESGRAEVYVVPFPPDPGVTVWPVSSDGGSQPRWSRDGRELFYLSRGAVWSVEITPGTSFVMGTHRRLFSTDGFTGTFDVDPDGQHFLMVRQLDGGAGEPDKVIVMENLLDELKARTNR